jgi:WD40 repeat protein
LILDTHTESILANLPESALVTSLTPELMDMQTVDLAFTHDSSRLFYVTTGAGPHNVRYGIFGDWNVAEGRLDHVIWKGNGSRPAVAISPDDHRLALLGAEYNSFEIWDLAAGKFVASAPSLSDYNPKRAYFSTDGTRLAVDIGGREIVIYDTATWRETVHFNLPLTNDVGPVYAISPDLSLLATTLNGGDITQNLDIWDPATGEKINTLTEGSGNTIPGGEFLNFTPDGRTLLRITNDGLVYAWNTADWRAIGRFNTFALYTYTFGGGLDPQRCCLFSSDGRTILVPSITEIDLFGLP